MLSNDRFVSVWGAVPAGDTENLVKIAVGAVRNGFAVVPCHPGTDEPMCALGVRDAKKEHECYHPLTVDTKARAAMTRLTKDGARPNLAVDLVASNLAVIENLTMPGTSPTVVLPDGTTHHWFEVPEGAVTTFDRSGHVLVPPSILEAGPVRLVGQTNQLPKELIDMAATPAENLTIWGSTDTDERVEALEAEVAALKEDLAAAKKAAKTALAVILEMRKNS
jgi:uncharacterized small protein (DUF1192 family)